MTGDGPGDTGTPGVTWGTSTFTPGDHDALAGPIAFGIVEHGHPGTRERLWQLVAGSSGLDDVLDELSADGLRSLPSFAFAQHEPDGVRIVARGDALVTVTHDDGTTTAVDAAGVRTWTEELVDQVAAVSMTIGSAAPSPEQPAYFLLAGTVPANRITRDYRADDELAPLARSAWNPAEGASSTTDATTPPADSAEALRHEPPTEDLPVAPPTEPYPAPASAAHDDPVEGTPGEGAPGDGAPADLPDAPVRTAGPPTAATFALLDPDADPPDAPPPPTGRPLISSVPLTGSPPPSPAPNEPELAPTAASTSEPSREHHDAGGHAVRDDGDTSTISRAELIRRRALGDSGPAPGPNQVRARFCADGHANPPDEPVCRSCRASVPNSAPVTIDRPPLAILSFSNGLKIPVDRPVLIGRNPKITATTGGELPRIVKFDEAGPGLSRTHARIHTEGWQLLLEDLNSTNGTDVTLPGRARRRLHPHEPVLVEHGATIHLDDDLECSVDPPT